MKEIDQQAALQRDALIAETQIATAAIKVGNEVNISILPYEIRTIIYNICFIRRTFFWTLTFLVLNLLFVMTEFMKFYLLLKNFHLNTELEFTKLLANSNLKVSYPQGRRAHVFA